MISAADMRRLGALNLSGEALMVVMDVIANSVEPEKLTAKQASNRRYYEKRKTEMRLISDTESVLNSVLKTTENALVAPPPVSPIDNHKPLPTPTLDSSLRSESSTSGQNGLVVDLFGVDEKIPKSKPDRSEALEAIRIAGETWNEIAAALRLPAIDSIKSGSKRERHTLARTKDLQADHEFGAADGWRMVANKIRGSPYLRGEVNGFVCTFDWIVNPTNFTKIMEGNYEVRQQKNGAAFGQPKRHHG